MSNLEKIFPGLAALRHYDRSWLRYDLTAGVSVAAVAMPVAIAYSQLAGMPPVNGLYASLLPLVAYAFFGTSRQLIMAPDAATCAIVATTVLPLAGQDPARTLSLTMALSAIAGIFCIVAGIARLGFLTNFLARPILTGYLNGIAICIISGQLGRLFGFSLEPAGFFRLMIRFFSKLSQTHGPTLITGVAIFILLRLLKRWVPTFPSPLIAVVVGILAASTLHLGAHGVALLGAIPAGLPALMIPKNLVIGDVWPLVLGALGLSLISFNSSMVTARSFSVKNRYELDSNQEFIALGMADLGAAVLQGFAVAGADSRTAVNDFVGGKSQLTSLVAAALLVLVLLFLTGPLALLPITVLSVVLINAALGLFDLQSLMRLRRISRREFRLSIFATLGVITLGVLPGVLVAVGMAMLQLLAKASHPHDAILGRIPGMDGFHDIQGHADAETTPGLMIYRLDAALLFFNADYVKSRMRELVQSSAPKPTHFLFDAETVPIMDTTGAACLEEIIEELTEQGIVFGMAEAKSPVRAMLEKTGLQQRIGKERLFLTLDVAAANLVKCQRQI